eukprot:7121350-Pyramimonas_sp.AAC.1
MLTYKPFTQPVLSFVTQRHTATDEVLKAEREGLQLLIASPRHSFGPEMMCQLKEFSLSHQPRPFSAVARSGLRRAGLRSEALQMRLKQFEEILARIDWVVAYKWVPSSRDF